MGGPWEIWSSLSPDAAPRQTCLWVLTTKGKQQPKMNPGLKPFQKHIIKASCDPNICCVLKSFSDY
jgi:hypothetical protein